MKYNLPHFKEIDLTQLDEYYDVEIEYKGHKIRIDLNFAGKEIEARLFDQIKQFIENIESEDSKNRTYIYADFKDEKGLVVKDYIEDHLMEIPDELNEIINFDNEKISPEDQLIQKLKLVRLGFYPDGKYGSKSFAVFDYTIDREITDQLIVVKIDEKGNLIDLAEES